MFDSTDNPNLTEQELRLVQSMLAGVHHVIMKHIEEKHAKVKDEAQRMFNEQCDYAVIAAVFTNGMDDRINAVFEMSRGVKVLAEHQAKLDEKNLDKPVSKAANAAALKAAKDLLKKVSS